MGINVGVKNWDIACPDAAAAKALSEKTGLSRLASSLLVSRGLDTEIKVNEFLNPEAMDTSAFNPMLFDGMEKAAKRFNKAIADGEKICIYGDYDVDGITSVSLLCRYLKHRGDGNFSYYIPDRMTEGYGMNCEAVERICASGVKLIVTVDNGVSSSNEINRAYELGMEVIVTDHHECRSELPDCVAVINPKKPDCGYPYEHLAGVGTAYKLVCACEMALGRDARDLPDEFVQLVSLGTVADMMPLVGENRIIVSKGLEYMTNAPLTGLLALMKAESVEKEKAVFAMPKIDSTFVSFNVAPRINAAGRIGQTKDAVKMLTTEDPDEAYEYAQTLCTLNGRRQSIETEIFASACRNIEANHDFKNDKVIVAVGEGWNHGVIGIVASRVTEKYKLPSILISLEDGVGKGSARSIEGFNINGAISACREKLVRFGGHELAAGLTIMENEISSFRRDINNYARDKITEEMMKGKLNVDLELEVGDITEQNARLLSRLEPFGCGNPLPLFCLCNAEISAITPIGQNRHLRLNIHKDGSFFTALLFGTPPSDFKLRVGDRADFAFNLDVNEFAGRTSVQLIVRDCRFSSREEQKIKAAYCDSSQALLGDTEYAFPHEIPTVEEMRKFFVYLRSKAAKLIPGDNLYFIACDIAGETGNEIFSELRKIIYMLNIFCEMKLISLELKDDCSFSFELLPVEGKVNMEDSVILQRLRTASYSAF